jgi:hypothetical protein
MQKGSKHTEETRAKISAANKGRRRAFDRVITVKADKEWAGYLSLLSAKAGRRPSDLLRDAIFFMQATSQGQAFLDTLITRDTYRNISKAAK